MADAIGDVTSTLQVGNTQGNALESLVGQLTFPANLPTPMPIPNTPLAPAPATPPIPVRARPGMLENVEVPFLERFKNSGRKSILTVTVPLPGLPSSSKTGMVTSEAVKGSRAAKSSLTWPSSSGEPIVSQSQILMRHSAATRDRYKRQSKPRPDSRNAKSTDHWERRLLFP